MKRGQMTSGVLVSVIVAAALILLIAAYASSAKIRGASRYGEIPSLVFHEKKDVDADFKEMLGAAGMGVGYSPAEGELLFAVDFDYDLFENASNFTGSYSSRFNSARRHLLLEGVSQMLSNGELLLAEADTNSSLYLKNGTVNRIELGDGGGKVLAYGIGFNVSNTTEVIWTPELETSCEINVTMVMPGYAEASKGVNRSKYYYAGFETDSGEMNMSFIEGELRVNFTGPLAISLNVTLNETETLRVYPRINYTKVNITNSSFADICGGRGSEPRYPAGVTNRSYGNATIGGNLVNLIAVNESGNFSRAYIDENGDCDFTDFEDEYFIGTGTWAAAGEACVRIDSFAENGSSVILEFAAGVEAEILKGRLVSPIYLNT